MSGVKPAIDPKTVSRRDLRRAQRSDAKRKVEKQSRKRNRG